MKSPMKIVWNILLIGIIAWALFYYLSGFSIIHIPYSDFKNLLKSGKLSSVTISDSDINMTFKTPEDMASFIPEENNTILKQLNLYEPEILTSYSNDPNLIHDLEDANVSFQFEEKNKLFSLLQMWLIPGAFILLLVFFLLARKTPATRMTDIGKSNAKIYINKKTDVAFKDVAGADEAKNELIEVVEFLKNPAEYRRLGAHAPRGVLLVGPPGTGKTLLAKAVAGEARVPFLSINGSEFMEMYVGVGAARVRDLFHEAHAMAPSIIFIDELDAIGRQRDTFFHSNDEREHTLNQLLSEMDGFDTSINVILIAATNRPEILDPALLRAGRFDRQVLVDKPDKIGRVQILNIYLAKIHCASDVDVKEIAAMTPGFTGADLSTLVNEAALIATRHHSAKVSMKDFNFIIERIIAGAEQKNRILSPNERRIVACHEMGHALVAMALPNTNPVHKVSIVQRGLGSLGLTMQRQADDRNIVTKEELVARITVLLGGQAAEHIVYGQVSTGAADDLSKVTYIAREMILHHGMDDLLGHVAYEVSRSHYLPGAAAQNTHIFSEKTSQEIDDAVRKIVQTAFDVAVNILKARRPCLDQGIQLLLEKETLDQNDLAKLHLSQTQS